MNVKYTQDSHIATVEEAKVFFHHVVFDLDINFHPDDDFRTYVNCESGKRVMDDDQADLYNRLMDEAFDVFDDEDAVYETAYNILNEKLKQ